MRGKTAAFAVAVCLVTGGSLATATPASATVDPPGGTWDHTWHTTDASPYGGTVYVEEYGDVVEVCDTAADGYNANAWVYQSTGTYYVITTSGGNGSCATARASDGVGYHNLPENETFHVNVYTCNNPDAPCAYQSDHTFLNDN
ncbi:hypothetical protein AB0C13_05120 [Streptomyces sp. NPDC049099]|uniref:hypothetical protein n=1 Tax=Streptomyces sp. NPDC049099 TaxID=3155768 RepID=UPI003423D69D